MKLKDLSDTNKVYVSLASLSNILLIISSIRNFKNNEYIQGIIGIILAFGTMITLFKWIKKSEYD